MDHWKHSNLTPLKVRKCSVEDFNKIYQDLKILDPQTIRKRLVLLDTIHTWNEEQSKREAQTHRVRSIRPFMKKSKETFGYIHPVISARLHSRTTQESNRKDFLFQKMDIAKGTTSCAASELLNDFKSATHRHARLCYRCRLEFLFQLQYMVANKWLSIENETKLKRQTKYDITVGKTVHFPKI